jgi:FkbM family methyltransferase
MMANPLSSLLQTFRFLRSHPLASRHLGSAMLRWGRWQIGSRLLSSDVIVPFVDDSVLAVRAGMTGATGNVYAGLHEFADMAFVYHCLRRDDLFVDVGANVGAYSVLAATAGACVIAFEPVPSTAGHLRRNVRINALEDRIEVRQAGLADKPGELSFTTGNDCTNRVATAVDAGQPQAIVQVETLDGALAGRRPCVIKIDAEGYEYPILTGANETLARQPPLAILAEMNGSAERYSLDEQTVAAALNRLGYTACGYDPFSRTLDPVDAHRRALGNVIFVRDLELCRQRLRTARSLRVIGETI